MIAESYDVQFQISQDMKQLRVASSQGFPDFSDGCTKKSGKRGMRSHMTTHHAIAISMSVGKRNLMLSQLSSASTNTDLELNRGSANIFPTPSQFSTRPAANPPFIHLHWNVRTLLLWPRSGVKEVGLQRKSIGPPSLAQPLLQVSTY